MYKRIVLSLSFTFLLVLPTFSFAQDTPIDVPGLGTLFIPSGIEIIKSSANTSNSSGNTLLIKENGIWRSVQIFTAPIREMAAQQPLEKHIFIMNSVLDGLTKDHLAQRPDSKILLNTPLKSSVTNNQPSLSKTTITLDEGFVVHQDYYILHGINCPYIIGVFSTDAESNYWQPIVSQIINNIKR